MASLDDSDLEPKPSVKRLAVHMAALLVVCAVVLILLSRSCSRGPLSEHERLPVYTGAYDVERKRAEVPDWEQVMYRVEEGYPSTAVYYFYRDIFEAEGWRPRPADETPEWKFLGRDKNLRAVFLAQWASPNQLRLVELRLIAVPDEHPPTMQVVVQRSRAILPDAER